MPEESSTARSITSRSIGGTPSCWTTPGTPDRNRMNRRPARIARGTIAKIQSRAAGARSARVSCVTSHPGRLEETHPAQLRELALMGVEHELPRIAEGGLEDGALALTEHERVGLFARVQRRARAIGIEEHPVKVNAVDQVELGDVDHVHPHQLADLDANRVVHEMVRHGVDRVHLVL